MGYINKNFFSPQISHIQLNYVFLLFWSIFGEIYRELLLLVQKWLTCTEILRKFVFLNMFEKGQILRKIWICLYNSFDEPSKRGQILTKNDFLPKVSHIQLNYVFRLFWSIFGKIHREFPFLIKKVTLSERSTKILRKLFFLTCLRRVNPDENLDLFKQMFLIKQVNGNNN